MTQYPGTPRWVKASGIIFLLGVILFIAVHLLSAGGLSDLIDHGIHGGTSAPSVVDHSEHPQ